MTSVAFSPDGQRILSGSEDGTLRMWDGTSGAELAVLGDNGWHVTSVASSLDGRRILSGSDDVTVRVWDATNGAELAVLRGHESWGRCMFSPDGRRILSGSWDRTVRVWDADSGSELAVLQTHGVGMHSVAFSPDGWRILGGSYEAVGVWDAQSYECIDGIQGFGDVTAIAAGPAFPFRLLSRRFETVLESFVRQECGEEVVHPIAWLPVELDHVTTHPSGCRWAGSASNYLALFQLEGSSPASESPG